MAMVPQTMKTSETQSGAQAGSGSFAPTSHEQDFGFGASMARRTTLILADASQDRVNMTGMAEAAGLRVLNGVTLAEAQACLDQIVAVDLIMLAAKEPSDTLAPIMEQVAQTAQTDHVATIIICSPATIEPVFALSTGANMQLLCDPDPVDMAAAIAAALDTLSHSATLHEPGRETEADRLQRLTEEVGRIARTLAYLSSGQFNEVGDNGQLVMSDYGYGRAPQSITGEPLPHMHAHDTLTTPGKMPVYEHLASAPEVTTEEVRTLLRLRRLRDSFFPADLFADPAWDMLLDLMAARLSGDKVSVSSLCIAAAVPATTALRWIRALTESGVLVRQADPKDARRVFIALSDESAASMKAYLIAARRIRANLL